MLALLVTRHYCEISAELCLEVRVAVAQAKKARKTEVISLTRQSFELNHLTNILVGL